MPEMRRVAPNTLASPAAAAVAATATSSTSPTAAATTASSPHHSNPDTGAATTAAAADPHTAAPSSIPPWVHVDSPAADSPRAPFLPAPHAPSPTRPNTRHYKPPAHYRPGRKWDHYRTAEPALLGAPIAARQLEWRPFMQSGPQPGADGSSSDSFAESSAFLHEGFRLGGSLPSSRQGLVVGRRADSAWLARNIPVAARAWEPADDRDPEAQGKAPGGFKGVMYKGKWLISPERQERTVRLFWRLLLKNAFVPLVFRITVLAFSTAALGVGATIFENVRRVNHDADPSNQCDPRASTYMAVIVGTVTVPYVGYVTWDEYTSKPLGLRSVAAKTLLLLCDLYFIVFSASNVSLAFDALLDTSWACYSQTSEMVGNITIPTPQTCPNNADICYKQRTLSGVLMVLLVAWLLCFSISVLRVVEKLRPE